MMMMASVHRNVVLMGKPNRRCRISARVDVPPSVAPARIDQADPNAAQQSAEQRRSTFGHPLMPSRGTRGPSHINHQ